jgi:flagellar basal-body rod protein FlgG
MLGSGARTVATEKLHTQGNFIQTGNTYDMGIQGKGFFKIQMPDGSTAYSRDGAFRLNQDGSLVTPAGNQLDPPITVPFNAISFTVGSDGVVTVKSQDGPGLQQVGTVQLADFINPTGLQPMGENLYVETAASGPPQDGVPGENSLGTIIQGSVEASNVSVVEELVSMIEAQRAYEMNSKAISAVDGMLRNLNQTL